MNFRKPLHFTVLLASFALMAYVASPAHGAFQLRLSDGISSITITDGDGNDSSGTAGVIVFNGLISGTSSWIVNVTTGISKPVFPASSSFAKMDLNSVNVSSSAGGSLTIELTDTDFPATSPGTLSGMIGGTTNGTLSAAAYKKVNGAEFDISNPDADIALGPFNAGAFSGTAADVHGALASYTMTLVVNIVHTGAGSTSFDFEIVNAVPEPTTLLSALPLLMIGGGLYLRRRKTA